MKIAVLFKPSVGKNQLNYFHNPGRRKTNRGKRWWGFSKDFPSQSYKYESQWGITVLGWTVVETSMFVFQTWMEDKSLYRYFPLHNATGPWSDVSKLHTIYIFIYEQRNILTDQVFIRPPDFFFYFLFIVNFFCPVSESILGLGCSHFFVIFAC